MIKDQMLSEDSTDEMPAKISTTTKSANPDNKTTVQKRGFPESKEYSSNSTKYIKSKYETYLYDKNAIDNIVNQGQQPFMEILSKQFRVIHMKGDFNNFQNEYLTNFLHRCLYKAPIHSVFSKFGIGERTFSVNQASSIK